MKSHCFYCHITFGDSEERVWFEAHPYHEVCNKKRERKDRLRAFLRVNRGQIFLKIEPRHHNGRKPDGEIS